MKNNYKPIGNYIQPVDERNTALQDLPLVGLSISKEFIPSIANTIGTDMSNYRVIERNNFAYCGVTSRNGEKITIALFNDYDKALISQAYTPFKIADTGKLLPEYLMMWFRRPEFDRYARFHSHGSVREIFDWQELCETQIPIPPISRQREIVAQYNAIQNRINQNNALIARLEQTAQALYKEWFVDNADEHWEVKKLGNVCEIKAGGDKPKTFSETKTEKCFVPLYSNGVTNEGLYGFTDKANYSKNSITISARGTIGFSVLRREDFDAIVRLLVLIPKIPNSAIYLWQAIQKIEFDDSGSVQNQLTVPQVSVVDVVIPKQEILDKYNSIVEILFNQIELKQQESKKLEQLKVLLLSRMALLEDNIYLCRRK
jgi:type I restriction enzyme S subunit